MYKKFKDNNVLHGRVSIIQQEIDKDIYIYPARNKMSPSKDIVEHTQHVYKEYLNNEYN